MPIDENQKDTEEGNNNLANDKVDVDIKPDVGNDRVSINICAFTLIFNCFSK